MVYTKQMLDLIRLTLKKGNERIAKLSRVFGKDSEVVKNQTTFLRPIAGSSKSFKKFASISASGNVKVDIPKFIKAIKAGDLTDEEINGLLIKMTGERFNREGELVETGYDGIDTVTSLKRKTEEEGYDESEWKEVTTGKAEISNNFQEEYSDFWNEHTLLEMTELMPELFNEGKKSYSQLQTMANKMKEINDELIKTRKQTNKKLSEE